MRVTGSKDTQRNAARLSIRIPSGQSLRWEQPEVGEDVRAIDLVVEGWGIATYPTALGESVDVEALLATVGAPIGEDTKAFECHSEGAVGYALRLPREVAESIDEWQARGIEVSINTPLAQCVTRAIVGSRRPKTVVLTLMNSVAYAALSNYKRLQYAEALPIGGEEELVTLLAHLNQDFELRGARFILLGKESAAHYKTLRKYFRRVSRES